MKKNKTIIAISALSLALVIGVGALTALAADQNVINNDQHFGRAFANRPVLTAEQRQAMTMEREAKITTMTAKRQAIETAMANNDYTAWVTAVGEDSPLLEKINADNFATLVEAHQLMAQARTKMESLGLNQEGFDTNNHRGFGGKGMMKF